MKSIEKFQGKKINSQKVGLAKGGQRVPTGENNSDLYIFRGDKVKYKTNRNDGNPFNGDGW